MRLCPSLSEKGRILTLDVIEETTPIYQAQTFLRGGQFEHPVSYVYADRWKALSGNDTIRVFRGGPIWKKRDKSMTCHLLSAQTAFGPDASVVAIRIVAASGGDSTGAPRSSSLLDCWRSRWEQCSQGSNGL